VPELLARVEFPLMKSFSGKRKKNTGSCVGYRRFRMERNTLQMMKHLAIQQPEDLFNK
jgi:hypothetical protein